MSSGSLSAAVTDESVPRHVPARTTEAWARHDADAFATLFSPAANVVIAGTHLVGRDAVRSYMSAAFAGPIRGTRVVSDPESVDYLTPDVVLLVTTGGVLLPGETEVSPGRAIRGTWVLVDEGEGWQIRAYHSSPIPQS